MGAAQSSKQQQRDLSCNSWSEMDQDFLNGGLEWQQIDEVIFVSISTSSSQDDPIVFNEQAGE